MRCGQRIIRRTTPALGSGAGSQTPPEDLQGIDDFGVMFMHRLTPAPASPSADPTWQSTYAHFSESLLDQLRGDDLDIIATDAGAGGSPAVANEWTLERRLVTRTLRTGTDFNGATVWAIMLYGNANPSGQIFPASGLRIINAAGVPVHTLLAVSTWAPAQSGGGLTIAASNNYMTFLLRQPLAGFVVPGPGYRIAMEIGTFCPVTITGYSSAIGSRVQPVAGNFEMLLHAMGFGNQGNPGIRAPYVSFDGVTFPP